MKLLWRWFKRGLQWLLLTAVLAAGLGAGSIAPATGVNQARRFSAAVEFDYLAWMAAAMINKSAFSSLNLPRYLDESQQVQIVERYLQLVRESFRLERDITAVYVDPDVEDPDQAAAGLLAQQADLERELDRFGRLAEAVIQSQVSVVLQEEGLAIGGQPFPPPLYQVTPLPLALVISPRAVIRQEVDISLDPDLSLDEITHLEQVIEERLDVSALVVPVGGVGVYPTMVMRSSNLPWLVEVVAHEWTHNYLTLRPLGMNYYTNSELRTINETTAAIVGQEVGRRVLERFYPAYLPPPQPAAPFEELNPPPLQDDQPPAFDYRAEMHETRVTVDALLEQGRVEEAEAYMEQRRVYFVEHGYQIRRLNQAYFAFYGAYADSPRGAFGRDPVGPMVRALRVQSRSLKTFIDRISLMTSFEELRQRVTQPRGGN